MSDTRPHPAWLREVEQARVTGAAGVLLTGNTGDRVHFGAAGVEIPFLRYALAKYFADLGYAVGGFTVGAGFEPLVPPGTSQAGASNAFAQVPRGQADPGIVLSALTPLLRRRSPRVAVILDYADHLVPATNGSRADIGAQTQAVETVHSWGQDDAIRSTENFVVLVSHEDGIHPLLRQSSGYRVASIGLPSADERLAFLRHLLATREAGHKKELGPLADDYPVDEFARSASGLRLVDVERLLRTASCGTPVRREDVRRTKEHAVRQLSRDLLEVIEPSAGFEAVAGARHAKRYFTSVRQQWRQHAGSCPQAVLLAGVPGCGKSHIVRAIAREFEAPLLVMRSIRDPYVGQSERNLERVLWIAENLAPCILWTDEIDQAVGQRGTGPSGDSGTSERMLARLFEYFGGMDKRGRILWIGTTNRPDLLDQALLDRFGVVVPWIHPCAAERAELLPLLSAQVGRSLAEDVDASAFADAPGLDLPTARGLQEILVRAGLSADARTGSAGSPISADDIAVAVRDYKPAHDPVEHEFLALTALRMTTFHSLLPWGSPDDAAGCGEVPPYVEPLLDRSSGRLDTVRLTARIAELEQLRLSQRVRR